MVLQNMAHLKEQIDVVERIRSAGPDAKLRLVKFILILSDAILIFKIVFPYHFSAETHLNN